MINFSAIETINISGRPVQGISNAELLHQIGGPVFFIGFLTLLILSPMIFCELFKHFTGKSLFSEIKRGIQEYDDSEYEP